METMRGLVEFGGFFIIVRNINKLFGELRMLVDLNKEEDGQEKIENEKSILGCGAFELYQHVEQRV